MKAKQILDLLGISRSTLSKYVKQGKIKVRVLPSGRYEYDDDSVYSLMGKGSCRKNVIYARSVSKKDEKKLTRQIELITSYCLAKGIEIDHVYRDVGLSIDLNRTNLELLIQEVFDYKIKNIFCLYEEKFSILHFDFFKKLFSRFGTKIIPVSNKSSFPDLDDEILQEAIFFIEKISDLISADEKKEKIDLVKKALSL